MSAEGQVGSGGVTQSMFKWIGSEIIKCIQRKGIRGEEWKPKGLIPKEEWAITFNKTFQSELQWQFLVFLEIQKEEWLKEKHSLFQRIAVAWLSCIAQVSTYSPIWQNLWLSNNSLKVTAYFSEIHPYASILNSYSHTRADTHTGLTV